MNLNFNPISTVNHAIAKGWASFPAPAAPYKRDPAKSHESYMRRRAGILKRKAEVRAAKRAALHATKCCSGIPEGINHPVPKVKTIPNTSTHPNR